jgi:cytochrome P450
MSRDAIPGPHGRWGGLNHFRAIRTDFREFSHGLHQEYGDIVSYRVFGQRVYQFASPDLAREVLVEKARSLRKPDNQKRAFARIIGNNLFTSDGAAWTTRRRLLGPLFLPRQIGRYRSIVVGRTRQVVETLADGEVDVSRAASTIALLSVAESLFGAVVKDVAGEFLEVASRLQAAVSRQIVSPLLVPLWIPTRDNRTVRAALKFFRSLIRPLIAERRRAPSEYADLLTALLTAADAEDGTRLSDREAMDEALTMLLAGSDTTAAALSWSAFLLAKHPNVQQELSEEVRQTADNDVIGVPDSAEPALADRVFQESMRLYPPAVAIARQAAESVEIGGVPVERGALLFVSVYSIHHDARWFADPEQFQPARFSSDRANANSEHAFLPFGLGPRACIGRRFATMEGPLVLAEFVRRCSLHLLGPDQEPGLETQLSLHPRDGLRLRVQRR